MIDTTTHNDIHAHAHAPIHDDTNAHHQKYFLIYTQHHIISKPTTHSPVLFASAYHHHWVYFVHGVTEWIHSDIIIIFFVLSKMKGGLGISCTRMDGIQLAFWRMAYMARPGLDWVCSFSALGSGDANAMRDGLRS
jgi:hypothetical protein